MGLIIRFVAFNGAAHLWQTNDTHTMTLADQALKAAADVLFEIAAEHQAQGASCRLHDNSRRLTIKTRAIKGRLQLSAAVEDDLLFVTISLNEKEMKTVQQPVARLGSDETLKGLVKIELQKVIRAALN